MQLENLAGSRNSEIFQIFSSGAVQIAIAEQFRSPALVHFVQLKA